MTDTPNAWEQTDQLQMVRTAKNDEQEGVPDGFTLESEERGTVIIRHRRSGMGCMNAFLAIWATGWTIGCCALLYRYQNGGSFTDGSPISPWVVAGFWGGEFLVVGFLVYLLCSRKTFRIYADRIEFEINIWCFGTRKIIPRESIEKFVQIKDGGHGKDSFPSWGLKLVGRRSSRFIFREPYEKSHWLGRYLADWANVVFEPAAPPPEEES